MLYFFALIAIAAVTAGAFYDKGKLGLPNGTKVIIGIFAALLLTISSMYHQVSTGHVGIVYEFGAIIGQRGEGLQWTRPWQSLSEASTQVKGEKILKITAFSQETQDVFMDITINTQVSALKVQELYRQVGANYFDILIRPRINQALKDETVKYRAIDVAPHREQIRVAVRERLTRELQSYSVVVEDFLVDNIDFSPAFKKSIEDKQVQQQVALAEEAKIASERNRGLQAMAKSDGDGQAELLKAKSTAEANRLISASLTPELVQFLTMQKLAPNVQVMMIPPSASFMMPAELLKPQK